jgi:alkanesulfonate monooxygenase SsuD/methylene tetrahydromethanopterin reductase-like flavin-dependent oxidoreductase (luciferase family)
MTSIQLQRPQTLADVAEIARPNSSEFAMALDEFVDEFYLDHLDKTAQQRRLDVIPYSVANPLIDAWIGAAGTAPSRRLAKPVCLGNSEALARPTDIQRLLDLRSGSAGSLHPKAKSSRRDKRPPNRHLPRRARAGRSFLVGNLVGYRR